MTPGNQWTMVSDLEMNKLKNIGYMVEVFGSPFNTRLPYFGSIYKSDEPFGRIGTYQEIMNNLISLKPILWRNTVVFDSSKDKYINLLIQPPSGDELLVNLCNLCCEIVSIRKVKLYIGVPGKNDKYLNIFKEKVNKYIVSISIADKSWDYYANQNIIDMKGREWYTIILQN